MRWRSECDLARDHDHRIVDAYSPGLCGIVGFMNHRGREGRDSVIYGALSRYRDRARKNQCVVESV